MYEDIQRGTRESGTTINNGSFLRSCAFTYLKDDTRKRIQRSDTQSDNYDRVLGIISSLGRMIPVIKHVDERAQKANRQNEGDNHWFRLRFHRDKDTLGCRQAQWVEPASTAKCDK